MSHNPEQDKETIYKLFRYSFQSSETKDVTTKEFTELSYKDKLQTCNNLNKDVEHYGYVYYVKSF